MAAELDVAGAGVEAGMTELDGGAPVQGFTGSKHDGEYSRYRAFGS